MGGRGAGRSTANQGRRSAVCPIRPAGSWPQYWPVSCYCLAGRWICARVREMSGRVGGAEGSLVAALLARCYALHASADVRAWAASFVSDAFVSDACVSDAFVSDARASDAFVSDALVSDAFLTRRHSTHGHLTRMHLTHGHLTQRRLGYALPHAAIPHTRMPACAWCASTKQGPSERAGGGASWQPRGRDAVP